MPKPRTLNDIRVAINSHLGQTKAEEVNWKWVVQQAMSAIDSVEASHNIVAAMHQLDTAIEESNERPLVDDEAEKVKTLYEILEEGAATFLVAGHTTPADIEEWSAITMSDLYESFEAFGFDDVDAYQNFLMDVQYLSKEISDHIQTI